MAKNIYVVTMANGNEVQFTNKKEVKKLKDIACVMVNGEDITTEFVKEDKTMAKNVINEVIEDTNYDEVVEAIEAVEEAQAEVDELEAPKNTILITASRGTNKKMAWYQIPTNPDDETIKVKGCAAMLPIQVAEAIGKDKFVSWIDQAIVEKFVAEGKPVRGMASTISDVFNRYCKVTELTGADKVNTVYIVFKEILAAIEEGTTTGGWEHAIEEVEEDEAPEVDSTDVADIEEIEAVA